MNRKISCFNNYVRYLIIFVAAARARQQCAHKPEGEGEGHIPGHHGPNVQGSVGPASAGWPAVVYSAYPPTTVEVAEGEDG